MATPFVAAGAALVIAALRVVRHLHRGRRGRPPRGVGPRSRSRRARHALRLRDARRRRRGAVLLTPTRVRPRPPGSLTPMERLGLVGLPNSGKSSLFNALTGAETVVAPHQFSTTETTVALAQVPDERVDLLGKMSNSKKLVYTGFEIVDIAALVKGASTGEGLGNRFLGSLRDCDAILYVLRAFEDPSVMGDTDPACRSRHARARAGARRPGVGRGPAVPPAARGEGRQVAGRRDRGAGEGRRAPRRRHPALPRRPHRRRARAARARVPPHRQAGARGRQHRRGPARHGRRARRHRCPTASRRWACACSSRRRRRSSTPKAAPSCSKGSGSARASCRACARAAYHLLGRRTFLTTGDTESRAWTFRAGAKAPECAGVIHSDLQRGFIRAEVIFWQELLDIGSWTKAKEQGKLRVEGKDYEVVDGDVLEIRFNV